MRSPGQYTSKPGNGSERIPSINLYHQRSTTLAPPPDSPRTHHWVALFQMLMLHCLVTPAHAASEEDIIKAAYLRNALNYCNWPQESFPLPTGSFQIGIAGKAHGLKKSLQMAFGKLGYRIHARKVEILAFQDPAALARHANQANIGLCHAIFLPESEEARANEWLEALGGKPILMISDDPGFITKGGAVSLVPNPKIKGRYQYKIHTLRLKSRGIRFNSGFLRITSTVKIVDKKP